MAEAAEIRREEVFKLREHKKLIREIRAQDIYTGKSKGTDNAASLVVSVECVAVVVALDGRPAMGTVRIR